MSNLVCYYNATSLRNTLFLVLHALSNTESEISLKKRERNNLYMIGAEARAEVASYVGARIYPAWSQSLVINYRQGSKL